jgi:nitroimidazol reductase NimA-like FMN-containing flavoprotein (pyridoxamine 5'-phosphate oxidase superfamily)
METHALSHHVIRRHPERAVPDEASAILAAEMVAHVGFCEDGQPFVIPMSYHYDPQRPDRLYLHGARESRLLQVLASGAPVSVAVTLVDGLGAVPGSTISLRRLSNWRRRCSSRS